MLVIIHGWSDTYRSFRRLGRHLVDAGVAPGVAHVRLGDYVSLDDDVTFDDLAHALQAAWRKEKISTRARSVDLVVHSTGGLVVRHWMTTFFTPHTNPIRRLLMLAPANFGSPLAHKGRSFIGRVVKGFKSDKPFQTGTHILRGLELASGFAWELAERDRFSADAWYGPGRVLATVLVGTAGYTGISAAANEVGTDGTVRVSTADLNPAMVRFDFAGDPQKPALSFRHPKGRTAFARIPGDNHSTLALKDGGPKNRDTLDLITRSLRITDAAFEGFAAELEARNARLRELGEGDRFTHGYQDTVLRVKDDHGAFVTDYFLEVFGKTPAGKVDDAFTRLVQENVLAKVHANGDNSALRSLLFNTTVLKRLLVDGGRPLFISLTATPDIRKTQSVGYSTIGYNDIGSIRLAPADLRRFMQPDRTVLVDVVLKRYQTEDVFRLRRL